MVLIPAGIMKTIPALHSTRTQENPMAFVKLYNNKKRMAWYITELCGETKWAWGLTYYQGKYSMDMFSLMYIEGTGCERDEFFNPTQVNKLQGK